MLRANSSNPLCPNCGLIMKTIENPQIVNYTMYICLNPSCKIFFEDVELTTAYIK